MLKLRTLRQLRRSNLYFETMRDCGNTVPLVFFVKGDLKNGEQREKERKDNHR